jgi:hypothetical protein
MGGWRRGQPGEGGGGGGDEAKGLGRAGDRRGGGGAGRNESGKTDLTCLQHTVVPLGQALHVPRTHSCCTPSLLHPRSTTWTQSP